MSVWGFSLLLSLPMAVSRGRAVGAVIVGALLLLIVLVMFHSMEWTRGTTPALLFRKILAWLRTYVPAGSIRRKIHRGEEFLKKGEWLKAIDLYVKVFDFDGMVGDSTKIAMKNEAVLSQLEILCNQVDYPFPSKQSGRLREDIYDYFVVRLKYLTPSEYDGQPLNHALNEDRFKDELNHFLEARLVGAYVEFFKEFIRKLRIHIEENGPFAPQPEMLAQGVFGDSVEEADPFAQDELETVDPFAGAAGGSFAGGDNIMNPPAYTPPVQVSPEEAQSPFGINDPVDPFRDQTGTMHRLSGPNDQLSEPEEATKAVPFPAPTGGFPSSPPADSFVSSPPESSPFGGGAASAFPSSPPADSFTSSPPESSPFAGTTASAFPSSPPSSSPFGGAAASAFPSSPPSSDSSGPAPAAFPSSPPSSSPFGGGGDFPKPTGGFPGIGNTNPFDSSPPSSSPFGGTGSSNPFPSSTGSFSGFPSNDKKED